MINEQPPPSLPPSLTYSSLLVLVEDIQLGGMAVLGTAVLGMAVLGTVAVLGMAVVPDRLVAEDKAAVLGTAPLAVQGGMAELEQLEHWGLGIAKDNKDIYYMQFYAAQYSGTPYRSPITGHILIYRSATSLKFNRYTLTFLHFHCVMTVDRLVDRAASLTK